MTDEKNSNQIKISNEKFLAAQLKEAEGVITSLRERAVMLNVQIDLLQDKLSEEIERSEAAERLLAEASGDAVSEDEPAEEKKPADEKPSPKPKGANA